MINEVNIINQVISGNAGAYRLLVNTYKDLVFTMVIRIVRSREEAEEVTQDTFLKAYHALANFKNESKFSTWLFRIAYNTAISRTRKRVITTSIIDDFVIENVSENSVQENLEQIEENERILLLKNTIDKLQADEQLLINLFYFHKQSIEEICQITELSESNVKVKLYRIRKKIYSLMNDQLNKIHVEHGL
jgi:RNA polymerase sigma factor (sigma-70 family)